MVVKTRIVSSNGDVYYCEFNRNFQRNGQGRVDFMKGGFYEGGGGITASTAYVR